MAHYKYVIVGGGMTGHAAVQGIRKLDKDGGIAIFSAEPDPPYKRPPLTKGLWTGQKFDTIWYNTEELGAELHLGRRITQLDPSGKRVIEEGGEEHTYEKLLLATGGKPRRLPLGGDDINYFRTVGDYRRLRDDVDQRRSFAVIGGGFIGSEIAAALAMNHRKVTMIFPDEGVSSRVFPPDLSKSVSAYFEAKGVELVRGGSVTSMERRADRFAVTVAAKGSESEIVADGVVAGIGIELNLDLARMAGVAVENGIVVDQYLRTTAPHIFAAGDVAAFMNTALGYRIRVEHEDNAKTMGRVAGENMAGAATPYEHLPFFYSDLFDLGYEAVGELDSRLETVSDWEEPYKEGVVYYLRDGRVCGVLLWNVWKQLDAARRLIAEPGPFKREDLRGRLPEASA
jgi:3-phenylpropionate/trans-cinnamate dioxygenase ferredoxin reductase subunit